MANDNNSSNSGSSGLGYDPLAAAVGGVLGGLAAGPLGMMVGSIGYGIHFGSNKDG